MKKPMSLVFLLLILQIQLHNCSGQSAADLSLDTRQISVEDVDVVMKKGRNLFDSARYEESIKEFLIIAQLSEAPQEDRIKARYFLMRIYRAYGEDEKVKNEIKEILKLNPNYTPSSRESTSVKKLFRDIKEEFLKEKAKEESEVSFSPVLKEDMAMLEHSLAEVSSHNESFSLKVNKMEKELKKLKVSFCITSLTLFLLLAAGIGFK